MEKWKNNIKTALEYKPPHLSCYSLTIEPKTILNYKAEIGEVELLDEKLVEKQYNYLIRELQLKGYKNYEFSSFALPGYYSINNSNYWNGKSYIGIGPSAHSYDGKFTRSWNTSNNIKYTKAITNNKLPFNEEKLNINDLYSIPPVVKVPSSPNSIMFLRPHLSSLFFGPIESNLGSKTVVLDGKQLKKSSSK